MATLIDKMREQASATRKKAAGVEGVTVPPEPRITFGDLPPSTGVLRVATKICEECWSLVLAERTADHEDWHKSLIRDIINPPMIESEPATGTRGWLPTSGSDAAPDADATGAAST
jgi:hypothetical protein